MQKRLNVKKYDHHCYLRYNGHYPFRNAAGDDEKDPLLRAKKTQDAMRRALPPTRQSYSIMAYQIVLDPTETVLTTLGLVSKDGIEEQSTNHSIRHNDHEEILLY